MESESFAANEKVEMTSVLCMSNVAARRAN